MKYKNTDLGCKFGSGLSGVLHVHGVGAVVTLKHCLVHLG